MYLNLCHHYHAADHSELWYRSKFLSHLVLRHGLLSPRTVAHPAQGNTRLPGTSELYNINHNNCQQLNYYFIANIIQMLTK